MATKILTPDEQLKEAEKAVSSASWNTPTPTPAITPVVDTQATTNLQEAAIADKKAAMGEIPVLGQKTPEQQKAEQEKILANNEKAVQEGLTTTEKVLVWESNKQIEETKPKIAAQEQVLTESQKGIQIENANIQQNLENYKEAQKVESIAWRDARLLELDKQKAARTDAFTKELAAIGLTWNDTASMNASTRQKYNQFILDNAQIESEQATLKGNLSDARNATQKYYDTIESYIWDKVNNYNILLNSSNTELSRLTGIQKDAIQNKIDTLKSQLKIEQDKRTMQNTILSSPIDVQQVAKNNYGLTLSDTAETQFAKLQSAQTRVDNINALIKTYPDLIGKISTTSTDAEISNALNDSKMYNAALDKASGDDTKNIIARTTALAKQLQKDYPMTYATLSDATADASKIAYMEYNGYSTAEAMQLVLNQKTASTSQVVKQLANDASKVATRLSGTDTNKQAVTNRLNSYIREGNYTTFVDDAISQTVNSLTGNTKDTIIAAGYMKSIADAISDDLNSFYKTYGTGSKIGMKITNNGLELIGETITDSNGKAQLAKINNKINLAIQTYTKKVSGAAFSAQEFERYRDVFPNTKNTDALNMAKIEALKESGDSSYYSTLGTILGDDTIADFKTIEATNLSFINNYVNNVKANPDTTIISGIKASTNLNGNYINRIKGGECWEYVNSYLQELGADRIFGDSVNQKIQAVTQNGGYTTSEDILNYSPKMGDIIVQKFSTESDPNQYGHVAVITGYDAKTGEITIAESNYYWDKTISYGRKMNKSQVAAILPIN